MHTTVDYRLILDETKKKAKAISDIKNWLGPRKFTAQTRLVKRCVPAMTLEQFVIMCDLGGIRGYPVFVWAEQCGIDTSVESAAS